MSKQAMKRLLLLTITITFTACARPGDYPISSNCAWIEDDHRTLNLETIADRRHLRHDAETAEDVAIRWADRHFGLTPAYEPRRDQCMAALFDGVARQHGVDVALVRQYSSQRDIVVDSAVFLTFSILFSFAAYIFAGRILKKFTPDEPGFWIMTVTMAIGVSLVGLMISMLGSIVVEGVRLNSGHLSYRMSRIPFRQHWGVLFLCGTVIFALATLLRTRVKRQFPIRT